MIERAGRTLLCDGRDQEVTGETRGRDDEMSREKETKRTVGNSQLKQEGLT